MVAFREDAMWQSRRQCPGCHPERQRGIFCPSLMVCHERRTIDPSLTLGMTTELTLGMTMFGTSAIPRLRLRFARAPLGMTSGWGFGLRSE